MVGRGRTLDMSATGILVALDRELEAGATVQLSLAWPGTYHNCESARLDVTGQVVRSEGVRIAVEILRHGFRVPRQLPGTRVAVAGNARRQQNRVA